MNSKTFNFAAHLAELAQHYAELMKNPATAEHAEHMVQMMAKGKSGLYVDLPRLVDVLTNAKCH